MSRRFIHNETPTRLQADADAGFEVEVIAAAEYDVLASDYDAVTSALRRALSRLQTMEDRLPASTLERLALVSLISDCKQALLRGAAGPI